MTCRCNEIDALSRSVSTLNDGERNNRRALEAQVDVVREAVSRLTDQVDALHTTMARLTTDASDAPPRSPPRGSWSGQWRSCSEG